MAAKRNRDFRVGQIEAMRARKKRTAELQLPLELGGLLVLGLAVFLGLSAFGILAFITAMACLGRGMGYRFEGRRLVKSIEAAEARVDAIDEND